MPLTDDEVDQLHLGLRLMEERKELAASLFYPRLFEIAPDTRPMFSDDIIGQTEKTIFAFGAVVAQIHQLEAVDSLAIDLARRHLAYGVKAHHYPQVGKAVISILAEVLGEENFTPEMETAWVKAYAEISDSMIRAAYGPEAAATWAFSPEQIVPPGGVASRAEGLDGRAARD
jgi:nitric oxide dioxygenase